MDDKLTKLADDTVRTEFSAADLNEDYNETMALILAKIQTSLKAVYRATSTVPDTVCDDSPRQVKLTAEGS